jgi:hypothetical protein
MRRTPEEDMQMGQIEELGPSGPSYKPYVSQELTPPQHLVLLQNLIYQLSVFIMQFLN